MGWSSGHVGPVQETIRLILLPSHHQAEQFPESPALLPSKGESREVAA